MKRKGLKGLLFCIYLGELEFYTNRKDKIDIRSTWINSIHFYQTHFISIWTKSHVHHMLCGEIKASCSCFYSIVDNYIRPLRRVTRHESNLWQSFLELFLEQILKYTFYQQCGYLRKSLMFIESSLKRGKCRLVFYLSAKNIRIVCGTFQNLHYFYHVRSVLYIISITM